MTDRLEIYNECYAYQGRRVTLRQTGIEDAGDLFRCFSYETAEDMQKQIQLWQDAYDRCECVHWSIVLNETHRVIGTVEMSGVDKRGILRLELQSRYEDNKMIRDIFRIVDNFFYDLFEVKEIITKCKKEDSVRDEALRQSGYKPLLEKVDGSPDYYIRFY